MIFNSIEFVFFFILVTSAYFILPHKFRWFLLLASSCYFYMAFVPVYILILGFTIVIDYFAGILIENEHGKKRKLFLVMSLVANIGVLAVFKYYNFLNENLTSILGSFSVENPVPFLKILLPIGLSFHTFQAMSYTIEVYRGNQKPERHFGIYALYVMFYPQLVAGPIERPQNILHQFYEVKKFDFDNISAGLKLILWGFFKKLVIADRLGIYVDSIYNNSQQHTGNTLLLATVFFAFQIYCDFSGYSDIAIGAARIMGFKLMTNFKSPYLAKSISEFWSRWHISLSSWFSDYLYKPLGGNRVSIPRWYFNLLLVFLISGLWHGANWTFIIWGGLNGFYLVFALIIQNIKWANLDTSARAKFINLKNFIKVITTFLLICFSWIFFRANAIGDAFYIIKKIATFKGGIFAPEPHMIIYPLMGIFVLLSVEIMDHYKHTQIAFLSHQNIVVRYASYLFIAVMILLLGVFDGGQFIYFQF
jgi:alginate O-acetyltransferase complex protein AlgI